MRAAFGQVPNPSRNLLIASLMIALAGLAACGTSQPTAQTLATSKGAPLEGNTEVPPDVFTVPDIPIPPGAVVLKEDTVIVGADETWTGQVVLHAPYRVAQMTEFYRKEMPRFSWAETSIVRARRTAISFTKDLRVVIVRISARSESEAEVDIVVSPNFAGSSPGKALAPRPSNKPASVPTPQQMRNAAPYASENGSSSPGGVSNAVPIPRAKPAE